MLYFRCKDKYKLKIDLILSVENKEIIEFVIASTFSYLWNVYTGIPQRYWGFGSRPPQ